LSGFYAPVDAFDLPAGESRNVKRLVARSVTVLMSLAALLVLYRLGIAVLRERAPAVLATAILALSPTYVYYSKMANLEIPYLLWILVAVLFSVRILRHHRPRDYWGYALASLAAITTKDQAFGLLVLPSLALPFALARHRDGALGPRGVLAALVERRLILPGLASFAGFLVIHNVVFDLAGFRHHLWMLLGPGSQPYQEHPNTLIGHLTMAWQALLQVGFVMGALAAVAAVAGVWLLARKRRGIALWLLLFPLSYYLFFITPIRYHYDRFFLPAAAILSVFAGLALWRLATAGSALRFAGRGLLGLVLLLGLYRVVVLDAALLTDTRYEAERWTAEQRAGGATVASFLADRQRVPRIRHFVDWRPLLRRGPQSLAWAGSPDYLVFNPVEALWRRTWDLLPNLTEGTWGYELERLFVPRWNVRRLIPEGVYSNLETISPLLVAVHRTVDLVFDAGATTSALLAGERDDWSAAGARFLEAPVCDGRRAFDNGMVAFNVHPDRWTRRSEPALFAIRNDTRGDRIPVFVAAAGARREGSVGVSIAAEGLDRRIEVDPGEPVTVELPVLAPGEVALVVVAADATWAPEGDRELGVRGRIALRAPP
ncbi:MAG: glycosyltransferase family 39 protein, partial [Thermoanaerobaculia bacterium]|nr:glycosyltransferase family 39 protein [Thermoanaerobaculia bacterium]